MISTMFILLQCPSCLSFSVLLVPYRGVCVCPLVWEGLTWGVRVPMGGHLVPSQSIITAWGVPPSLAG